MLVEKSFWERAKLGLAAILCCLPLSACAARHGAMPIQAPLFANAKVRPTALTSAQLTTAQAQPRVIIAAPPPVASAPENAANPAELKPFTPVDSPLLAHYDNKPHGEPPKVEPEFAASSRRPSGWQVSSYPFALGYGPYYGYTPYWGGGFGYSPYYGGYYGYPRGIGLGVGLGLGVGFGLAARPYYGGGYYGHGPHGLSYAGGRAYVTGGHAGRRR